MVRRRGPAEVATQIREARSQVLTPRERHAIAAFVAAWHDHFPGSFGAHFGEDSAAITTWAAGLADDHGTFIKLRRIAIANLATVL